MLTYSNNIRFFGIDTMSGFRITRYKLVCTMAANCMRIIMPPAITSLWIVTRIIIRTTTNSANSLTNFHNHFLIILFLYRI